MLLKKVLTVASLTLSLFVVAGCSTTNTNPCNGSATPCIDDGANATGAGQGTAFGPAGDGHDPMKVGNQSYYFDFDQSNPHASDQPSIKVQADYLATHPNAKVLLTGNTDERGSREYNIGLGQRRAESIETILEADGVNKNQITTVSYGAEKPVALGHDEASYSKNRRVDLVYQSAINGN